VADIRITATWKRRDEPEWLIDDLRANLAPWVDSFVELQTDRDAPRWPHEGRMLREQRRLLRQAGATWVLFIDPDERIEDRAAQLVRPAIEAALATEHDPVFGFPLREMWTPTQWRCDGQWGSKMPRHRMFLLRPGGSGQRFANKPIHCGVAPFTLRRHRIVLPTAMYHLKNIEPANRVERAAAYLAADPTFKHQRREGKDWSWLHDEEGLELAEIEPGRGFTPPYVAGSYQFKAPGSVPAETMKG
jgi:hypothetical protein